MILTRTVNSRRWALAAGAATTAAVLLSGCSGGGTTSSGSGSSDSINYALPANFTPNWILPVGTAAHLNTNNSSISQSLWEPLIAYDGSTGKVGWNKDNSLATAADFAEDGKSVDITLGDRHWSDGEQITSRDVQFWFNLVKANKEDWASYSPGKAPDNWTALKIVDDTHFTITFDKAYNTQWMLANELSMIRPMPQHVWDKTSDAGKVSDLDLTPRAPRRCGRTSTRPRRRSPVTPPTRSGRRSAARTPSSPSPRRARCSCWPTPSTTAAARPTSRP